MAKEESNPTMKDVAQEAGVAVGTVSKVINRIPVGDPSQITLEWWERFCFGMMELEKRMGWGT